MDLAPQANNIVIALDQATNVTGYAIFVNGDLKEFGHTKFDGDYLVRIVQLRDMILNLIQEYKEDNLTFAIEDIQLQKIPGSTQEANVLTYKKLAHVQGVLLELFTELYVDYIVVPSATWRSTCNIKGRLRADKKKAAQEYVKNTFGIKATQDEADAICIGQHILLSKEKDFDWS